MTAAKVIRIHPHRDSYRLALNEWRAALTAWNNAGEPTAGPVFERMWAGRKAFIAAGRAEYPDERLR